MNRTELIKEIGKRTGFTQVDINEVLTKMFDVLEEEIVKCETVKVDWLHIGGIYKEASTYRDIRTQEIRERGALIKPFAKIGIALKKRLKNI